VHADDMWPLPDPRWSARSTPKEDRSVFVITQGT
jgi:hypothetical protein